MQRIKLFEENTSPKGIEEVVAVLSKGGIIIYPTDGVYAMGCDITNAKAIERLAAIKKVKVKEANFSMICDNLSLASKYIRPMETQIFRTVNSALPGPYTFIFDGGNKLPKLLKYRKTIGVRIPKNNIILEIVSAFGKPLTSTSVYADTRDEVEYVTDPDLIYENLKGQADVLVDGGYGKTVPSTVIAVTPENTFEIIREGAGALDIFAQG